MTDQSSPIPTRTNPQGTSSQVRRAGPSWLWSTDPIPDPLGRADKAVRFVRKLRLHEGRFAGKPFPLADWQERLIQRIYGPVDELGRRQVRTAFVMVPRGSGKSTWAAALGLLHTFGPEKEPGGQVIAAAADREQASIVFGAASRMIQQDPVLSRITNTTPSIKRIAHPASGSTFRAISHESYSKHGLSISCLLADEIHAWPTRELWDVLVTSFGKRDQPLALIITTAGVGRTGIAWELYEYAKRVQDGTVEDRSFLPILLEPPASFDWRDPEVWAYVNPALGVFRSVEEMQTSAKRAEHVPAQQAAFRQLYLNEWRDGAAEPWLDLAIWDEGAGEISPEDIEPGTRCWIGVDLSSTQDLTAVVAVLEHGDGYLVMPKFFVPADGIRRRSERDGVGYALWAEQGFITATGGSVVDYGVVEDYVADLAERFRVEAIAIDRWNSTGTQTRLQALGLPVVTFGQGFASMSPAVKEVERLVLNRQLAHDGCPVLRWCLANVAIAQDPAGNQKIDRSKAKEKVDGSVALCMAIGVAAASPAGSVYQERPYFLAI
jgi:phage terminase large subunit-like protein